MQTVSHEHFPPRYKWNVMIIVMIGTVMAMLDSSIVNVSIPAIMADFGVNIDDIEWIMTGYMLAFATLMPLTAWLRDRIGYKNIYLGSLFVFTLGSILCGMAWNLPSLIAARVIQALGGGALAPTGMAMISEVFPPNERGKALGIWGLGIIIGPAIGPTLGGYLTTTFGWRSIFLVNLPIGIIGLMLAMELLMKDKPHKIIKRPFDMWGFLFLSAFLVSFLLGLSKGEREGWTSLFILSCFLISIISFIGFLLTETQSKHGIIDLRLLKSPVFSVCTLVSAVRSIGLFGGIFLLPLFIQRQMGYTELQSGLILLPGSIAMALIIPFAGHMSDRVGPRIPTLVGLILLAFFMFMYRNIDINTSIFSIILPTLVRSVGMVLLMAPIITAAMNSVPLQKTGMASSMLNIIQQVGGSIGIALFGTLLTNRSQFHLGVVADAFRTGTSAFAQAAQNLSFYVHSQGLNHAQAALVTRGVILKKVVTRAMVMSFQDAFIIGGIIMVLAIPTALLLPLRAHLHVAGKNVKAEIMQETGSLD